MNWRLIVGVVLLLLGAFSLIYGELGYTKEETVVEFGPIEAKAKTRENIPVPPIVGGLVLLGGGILVYSAARRRKQD